MSNPGFTAQVPVTPLDDQHCGACQYASHGVCELFQPNYRLDRKADPQASRLGWDKSFHQGIQVGDFLVDPWLRCPACLAAARNEGILAALFSPQQVVFLRCLGIRVEFCGKDSQLCYNDRADGLEQRLGRLLGTIQVLEETVRNSDPGIRYLQTGIWKPLP